MHLGKGTYLMGRCGGSMVIALDRRLRLIELGIDPGIIKIHPDDILDSNIELLIELGYKAQLMNYHEIKLDIFKGYGAKVIGVMLVQMSMSKLILLVKLKS